MADNDKPAGLDFLDFLFTVAISVGLTPELLNGPFTGLLTESSHWKIGGPSPSCDDYYYIGVFVLGFFNLTLSWFGYHASIHSRPLNYFSGYGMMRFILDVSLVIVYGVILLKYHSPTVVFVLMALVWVIFVIWDVLKVFEYWTPSKLTREDQCFKPKWDKARAKSPQPSKKMAALIVFQREWVSLLCCMLLLVVVGLYFLVSINRWIILMAVLGVTVFYRFNKNHLTWERIFGITKWLPL